MGKFDINPFDRSALTDYRLLAGRSSELKQIRLLLRNASKVENRIKSILISGERGVGKTSFINVIHTECIPNNIIPIRINLTESNSQNQNEFFWHLFDQLLEHLYELGLLSGKGGAIDKAIQSILFGDGMSDQVNWMFRTPILRKNYLTTNKDSFEFDKFTSDLTGIRKLIVSSGDKRFNNQTKILFLVDEAQKIYGKTSIIENLRFLIQNYDSGIGFVFAGDNSYESSSWELIFGGTYREFSLINLNNFKDVEDVVDYFNKSLESINWTTKEIEDELFYRFRTACRNIFLLSSGKPAWINTIACKMFERCMNGESSKLKFDRLAQGDIKRMLEDSGQVDRLKLDFIESLALREKKWLAEIFSCELCTFNEVFYYAKFFLLQGNALTKEEFESFCKLLVEKGIIIVGELRDESAEIGFNSKQDDFLDKNYLAFGPKSDTIKQWLQINSDGKFRFSRSRPELRFIEYVNTQITSDLQNMFILYGQIRISDVISKINNGQAEEVVEEWDSEYLDLLYKTCKKFSESRERHILFGAYVNPSIGWSRSWNLYNFDDKDKVLGFAEVDKKLNQFIQAVNSYRSESHDYYLELTIDRADKPNMNNLQKAIIKSGDSKKRGIVIEDKMEEMTKHYLKSTNVKDALREADFLFSIFEEGHDLGLRDLNNTAYILLSNGELNKAEALLNEAMRKIRLDEIQNSERKNTITLILYNLGILSYIRNDRETCLNYLKEVVGFFEEEEKIDDTAGALRLLELDENGGIILNEIREGDSRFSKISTKVFAEMGIEILQQSLGPVRADL